MGILLLRTLSYPTCASDLLSYTTLPSSSHFIGHIRMESQSLIALQKRLTPSCLLTHLPLFTYVGISTSIIKSGWFTLTGLPQKEGTVMILPLPMTSLRLLMSLHISLMSVGTSLVYLIFSLLPVQMHAPSRCTLP